MKGVFIRVMQQKKELLLLLQRSAPWQERRAAGCSILAVPHPTTKRYGCEDVTLAHNKRMTCYIRFIHVDIIPHLRGGVNTFLKNFTAGH